MNEGAAPFSVVCFIAIGRSFIFYRQNSAVTSIYRHQAVKKSDLQSVKAVARSLLSGYRQFYADCIRSFYKFFINFINKSLTPYKESIYTAIDESCFRMLYLNRQ